MVAGHVYRHSLCNRWDWTLLKVLYYPKCFHYYRLQRTGDLIDNGR